MDLSIDAVQQDGMQKEGARGGGGGAAQRCVKDEVVGSEQGRWKW